MKQKGIRPHELAILLKIAVIDKNWMNEDLAEMLKIS